MKLSAKMKKKLISIVSITLVILISLSTLGIAFLRTLDDYYRKCVVPKVFDNIFIYDCNGQPIYEGNFSDDQLVRLSTFHIIGDRIDTLPNSVLSTRESSWEYSHRITKYIPEVQNINLTIDLELQKAAYAILNNNQYKGCITVSDYKTGKLKVMVSTPSIDVCDDKYDKYKAEFEYYLQHQEYGYSRESTIFSEPNTFPNKAGVLYQPGSIFTPITVAAIIEKNSTAANLIYECNNTSPCFSCKSICHGTQTLSEILSNNCSSGIAFAANKFLTARELSDFVSLRSITYSDAIKNYPIKTGDLNSHNDFLLESAIGKYETLLTPLSISSFYSSIANDGIKKEMYLYQDDVKDSDKRYIMDESTASFLENSLSAVTRQEGFTCNSFGAKGTTEYEIDKTNAYFVCCLTDSNLPDYTVMVFLEDAEADDAVNIAKEFITENIMY